MLATAPKLYHPAPKEFIRRRRPLLYAPVRWERREPTGRIVTTDVDAWAKILDVRDDRELARWADCLAIGDDYAYQWIQDYAARCIINPYLFAPSFTPTTVTYSTAGTSTETSPSGATNCVMESWGGGGGGGKNSSTNEPGGGGAGGYCKDNAFSVTGGTDSISRTTGSNGSGKTGGNGNGTAGTASTTASGTGGFSGRAHNAGAGNGGQSGGAGGTGGSASGGATSNFAGSAGENGTGLGNGGAGGGSAVTYTGGSGGISGGGGGAGGNNGSNGSTNGGNGGAGRQVFDYT